MSAFTDVSGQKWTLEIDGFLLDRIEQEAKVDLANMSANGLFAVERDVKALIRVLSVACEEQIKQQLKTAIDFQKQIRKNAITRARAALLEALADFFPESEWSAMQLSLATRKSQPEMTPEQMQLAAGFLKMDPEVQRDVMSMVKEEVAGGSLPLSQGGVSAHVPAATPSMPAADSPESATSIPEDSPSETSG